MDARQRLRRLSAKTKKNKSIRDALPREGEKNNHGCFFVSKDPAPRTQ